jgi:hypothetical protein
MADQPLVSIVLPTYNGSRYLLEAIGKSRRYTEVTICTVKVYRRHSSVQV